MTGTRGLREHRVQSRRFTHPHIRQASCHSAMNNNAASKRVGGASPTIIRIAKERGGRAITYHCQNVRTAVYIWVSVDNGIYPRRTQDCKINPHSFFFRSYTAKQQKKSSSRVRGRIFPSWRSQFTVPFTVQICLYNPGRVDTLTGSLPVYLLGTDHLRRVSEGPYRVYLAARSAQGEPFGHR